MILLPGGYVLLDPEDTAIMVTTRTPTERWWRSNGTTTPRALAERLAALEGHVVREVSAGSAHVPSVDGATVADRFSSWPTTTEAAKKLGCSPRSLTKAVNAGRLSAERDCRGHWRLNPDDLHRYKPRSDCGPRAGVSRLAPDSPR